MVVLRSFRKWMIAALALPVAAVNTTMAQRAAASSHRSAAQRAVASSHRSAQPASASPLSLPDGPRYTVQHFGDEFGLSVVTVNDLAQDRDGFLWIATQTGLYRYDGSRVVTVPEAEEIVGHYIDELLVAPDSSLWIKGSHGLARYQHGRFDKLRLPPENNRIRQSGQSLAVDRDGTVYVVLDGGIMRAPGMRDPAATPPPSRVITIADGLPGKPSAIVLGADDAIWFTAGRRLCRFLPHSARFQVDSILRLPDEAVAGIAFDGAGTLWLRTKTHLARIDPVRHRLTYDDAGVPPANPDVGWPILDRAGNLLVPSVAGLVRRDHGRWQAITADQGLTGNDVQTALQDREGIIWVGGSGTGLDRVIGTRDWSAWTTDQGLPDNSLWSTARDSQGRLWVASAHGVAMWENLAHTWQLPTDTNGFRDHEIRQLERAADGSIWALSPVDGIVRIDPQTLMMRYSHQYAGEPYIFEAVAPDGTIWATTSDRLVRFDRSSLTPRPIDVPLPPADSVSGGAWRLAFAPPPSNVLWLTGRGRVMRYDGKHWRVFHQADGVVGNSVTSLVALAANDVWIGYDDVVAVTHLQLDANGRPHPFQHHWDYSVVARDAEHRVWLSGTDGLTVVARNGASKSIGHADGLIWDDISPTGVREESDGSYLIATSRGLARFVPHGDLTDAAVPGVKLTSVAVAGRERLGGPPTKVEYNQGTLSAYFTPLTLNNPDAILCRYRLYGFDEDFATTTARSVHYTALPPGNYSLAVQCRRGSSDWTLQPATYSFTVARAFWETWWARLIEIAIALDAVWVVVQFRTRTLEARRRVLQQAVADRNAELVAKNRELREMSLTDPLTHVRNRRYVQETIDAEIAQLRRIRGGPHTGGVKPEHPGELIFVMIDIDGFKSVNDRHGHAVGDRLLQLVAERLGLLMRASDVLARWGGEEFLLICRSTDRLGAQVLAQRILDEIGSQSFQIDATTQLQKTCSVGWAPFPWAGDGLNGLSVENVIELADLALYLAKREGRNQCVGLLPTASAIRAPHELRMEYLREYPPDLVRIVRSGGDEETAKRDGGSPPGAPTAAVA